MSTIVTLPDGTKIESGKGPKQAPKGTEQVDQALGPVQEDKAVQPPQGAPQGPQKRRMPQVGETIDVPGFGTQPVTYEMLSDPQTAAAAFALYNNDPTVKEIFNATGGGPTAAPTSTATSTSEQVANTGFTERDKVPTVNQLLASDQAIAPAPTGTQAEIDDILRQKTALDIENLKRAEAALQEEQRFVRPTSTGEKVLLGLQEGFRAAAGLPTGVYFKAVVGNKKMREAAIEHNRGLERTRDKFLDERNRTRLNNELRQVRAKLKTEEGTGQIVNGLINAPFLKRPVTDMTGFERTQSDLREEAIALQEAYRNNPSDPTINTRASALASNLASQEGLFKDSRAKSRVLLPYIADIGTKGTPDEATKANNIAENVSKGLMTLEDAVTALAQIKGAIEDKKETEDINKPEDVGAEIQRFEKELNRLEGYIPQTEEDLKLKERGFTYGTERDALRSAKTIKDVRSIGRDLVQKTNDRIRRLGRSDRTGERQEEKALRDVVDKLDKRVGQIQALVDTDSLDDFIRTNSLPGERLGLVADIQAMVNQLERSSNASEYSDIIQKAKELIVSIGSE